MSADDVAKTSTTRKKRPKSKTKNASKKRRNKVESLPWWRRGRVLVTGGILALGALASAITAILGLVLPEPDLVDKAEITSIDIIASVPLSEYARRVQPGQAARRGGTAPDLALVGHSTDSSDGAAPAATASVGPTAAPAEQPSGVPSETPSDVLTAPPAESPSDSPSKSPSPSPSKSPTGSPSESPTGSPSGSPTGAPSTDPSLVPPGIDVEMSRYEDVLAELSTVAPDLELPGPDDPPSVVMVSLISTMKDRAGEPVPAAEAARRLVSVLGHTRSVQTHDGKLDPLGVIVTANMRLEGLRGRQLGVYWEVWSRSGVSRLYDRWLDEVPVARIAAERQQDAGAVQFWVPMPKRPGTYLIHVIIKDGDKLMFVGRSDLFE